MKRGGSETAFSLLLWTGTGFQFYDNLMFQSVRLVAIEDCGALPVHAAARPAFEACVSLAGEVRPIAPPLTGLFVVTDDPTSGGFALVCGLPAFAAARESGSDALAVRPTLDDEQVRQAAKGERASDGRHVV